MTTTDADALLAAIDAHPAESTPRAILQDELIALGRWDWPTVRGYVLANPESDGRRLLAADLFESEGQSERAEFIRVQVELDRVMRHRPGHNGGTSTGMRDPMKVWRERVAELRAREESLWGNWGDPKPLWEAFRRECPALKPGRWSVGPESLLGVRPADERVAVVERGFIGSITCSAADAVAHLDAILAEHPVRRVRLSQWTGDVPGLEERYQEAGGTYPALRSAAFRFIWPAIEFDLQSEPVADLRQLQREWDRLGGVPFPR